MRKVLLTLLVVVLIFAGLGAAGFAGYRYGYAQGVVASSNGTTQTIPPGFGYGPQRMPMHEFGFDRGLGRGERGFGMMRGGMMSFGFFGPLFLLVRIAFWALVIWAIYMLVTRSGWRLTRTTQTVASQPTTTETTTTETEVKG
jgi:hypothetical protein